MKYLPYIAVVLLLAVAFNGLQFFLIKKAAAETQEIITIEAIEEVVADTEPLPLEDSVTETSVSTTDETEMLGTSVTTSEDLNLEVSTTTPPTIELTEVTAAITREATSAQPVIEVMTEPAPDIPLTLEPPAFDPFQLVLESDWREACIRGAFAASGYESTGECLNDRRPF